MPKRLEAWSMRDVCTEVINIAAVAARFTGEAEAVVEQAESVEDRA